MPMVVGRTLGILGINEVPLIIYLDACVSGYPGIEQQHSNLVRIGGRRKGQADGPLVLPMIVAKLKVSRGDGGRRRRRARQTQQMIRRDSELVIGAPEDLREELRRTRDRFQQFVFVEELQVCALPRFLPRGDSHKVEVKIEIWARFQIEFGELIFE